jgi:hypothetical protein
VTACVTPATPVNDTGRSVPIDREEDRRYNRWLMPLTVFDIKGVPGHRRERIEAAVVAGGKHASGPHEAWITADPFRGGFKVLITGPHGLERTVAFALADDPAVVAELVLETLEE